MKYYGKVCSIVIATILILLFSSIAIHSSIFIPIQEASALGNIDLVKDRGFRFYSQLDQKWANTPVGPNNKIEVPSGIGGMENCGCFIAALASVTSYYLGYGETTGVMPTSFQSLPKFRVEVQTYDPNLMKYVKKTAIGFYPNYIHQSLIQLQKAGYKGGLPSCDTLVKDLALQNIASPVYYFPDGKPATPTGVTLKYSRGFDTALVNKNLMASKPTLVITKGIHNAHTWIITGYDANTGMYKTVNALQEPWDQNLQQPILGYLEGPGPETYLNWIRNIALTVDVQKAYSMYPSIWLGDEPAPIEILAINPDGRKGGYNPETKEFVNEDPSVSYGMMSAWSGPFGDIDPGDPQKFLGILNPTVGTYRFEIIGTGDGPFKLTFSTISADSNQTDLRTVQNTITKDQLFKYELHYSSTGTSTISEVPTFTPEARARDDVKGAIRIPVNFDGSLSSDIDGSIVSYSWNFGDGTTSSGNVSQISHSYTTPGKYNVKLTVTDNQGATNTATIVASIREFHLPVANPSGPYIGWANSSTWHTYFNFHADKSFDPDRGVLTAKWDFGDGSSQVNADDTGIIEHSYNLPGNYTVKLIVNNGRNDSEQAITTAEVFPSVPARMIDATPSCGNPGSTIVLSGFLFGGGGFSAWDLSEEPFSSAIIEHIREKIIRLWNERDSISVLPSFPDWSFQRNITIPLNLPSGTYDISWGDEVSVSTTVTVPCPHTINHTPIPDAGGPYYSGNVGIPVSFDGSGSHDLEGSPLTYKWYFGDNITGTGVNPQHTYASLGTYIVTLVVNDGSLSSVPTFGTHSFAKVTVNETAAEANHAPVAANDKATTDQGIPVNINVLANDTDMDHDTLTIRSISTQPMNGTVVINSNNNTITYMPNANFFGNDSFTYKANDGKLNSTNTGKVSITVNHVNHPPIANAGPDQTVNENTTNVRLNGTASTDLDPGDTIASYFWTQTAGSPKVTLNSANTATPSFTAPTVTADTTLTFQLTVTDTEGSVSSPTTVNVLIKDSTVSPTHPGTIGYWKNHNSATTTCCTSRHR